MILLLFVLCGLMLSACTKESPVPILKIGLTEEPRTLNVWLAGDVHSRKILSQIYQPLYVYDPVTLKLVPWLAETLPVYDEAALSYTVTLRKAHWSDGTPVTSGDVAYTGNLIKEFKIPRHISRWRFIKKIEAPDPQTVVFYLKKPKAVFLSGTLTAPIVQEKEWTPIAQMAKKMEKPRKSLLNHKMEHPVGSGPFKIQQWQKGSFLHMKRNPHFFGLDNEINGRKLGPFVEDVIYKVFGTSDVAILALKKGSIDMFWWNIQPGYIEDLEKHGSIRLFSNEKSALYFMGFNLRRPPFNDKVLRRAVATMIDKDFILTRILQGNGTKMHSVIAAENHFWYCDTVARYGDGLNSGDRIKKVFKMLSDAGYSWQTPPVDENGKIQKATGIILPDGNPMERFTILTPPADYDPHRAMSGMMIQEWLRAMGLPAYSRPMAFGALLQTVKANHEFDAFILGYGKLRLDPDYVRNLFHSKNDKPRGWNMSGYRNAEFDAVSVASQGAMNPDERRKMVLKMQMLVMDDIPYIPLYKPSVVEAIRTDRFKGWVEMLGGIGNIWSICQVKPVNKDDD